MKVVILFTVIMCTGCAAGGPRLDHVNLTTGGLITAVAVGGTNAVMFIHQEVKKASSEDEAKK